LSTPFANDQVAYDYFAGKGLTNFQAAAIVGNLDQESGINPSIAQSGGGVGRGIAQWSTGGRWDTAKGDNVLAYATAQGKDPNSLGLQLDFVWYELQTFPDYGLAKLQASSNVSDATVVVEMDYEGCDNVHYPECAEATRIMYAKGVLDAYGSDPVQSGGGAGGSAAAGSGMGGGSAVGGAGAAGISGATNVGGAGMGNASAGTTSGGGTTNSAGGAGLAGGSSAGAPSSAAGAAGGSSTNPTSSSGSSCTFAAPSPVHSPFSVVLALGFALGLRRKRRRA